MAEPAGGHDPRDVMFNAMAGGPTVMSGFRHGRAWFPVWSY
ncbi:MAG: hypothetical protein WC815_03275 [Vicinamibacterales bacterium]